MPKELKYIIFYGVSFNVFRMLIGAISAVYILNQGLSFYDLGMLKSFQSFLILTLDIPLSYISDKYSRKLSVSLSVLLGALWLIMTGIANYKWEFYFAEALNAISISLFNGAFISYLIDVKNKSKLNKSISNQNIISKFSAYQSHGMAISAFLGAAFIKTESSIIWFISGVLMLILFIFFTAFLPSDIYQPNFHQKDNSSDEKKMTWFSLLINDMSIIMRSIKKNGKLRNNMYLVVIALFYMQIILQFWQPIISIVFNDKRGLIYGIIFSMILLVQGGAANLAGHDYFSKKTQPFSAIFLIISPLILLRGIHIESFILVFLSLLLVFFSCKFCWIEAVGDFHDVLDSKYRSTFDALTSFLNRILVIIFFPIITYMAENYGFLFFSYLLTGIAVIFIIIKFKDR